MAVMFHPNLGTLIKFTENEISEAKHGKISRHLKTCRKCRETVSSLEEVSVLYASSIELSPEVGEKIKAGISEVKRSDNPEYAEIKSVIGTLSIFQGESGEAINGLPGMILRKGDRLKLGGQSKALIQLTDGSHIYINEDTEMVLGDEKHSLSMPAGEFFAMMKPQRERFTIHTPAAVLGVVGTDFDTHVSKDNRTTLKVLKGTVSYKNESGEVLVGKKQQATGTNDNGPRATSISDTGRITEWTKGLNNEGKKGKSTMKIAVIILAVIIAAAGMWFVNGNTDNAAGTSGSNQGFTEESVLDDLRKIQSNPDIERAILDSPLYLVNSSKNVGEYARKLIYLMPGFVRNAIPDEDLMKIAGDARRNNDPAAYERMKYMVENTKILDIDMPDNPSEGNIAIVRVYDPASSDEYNYWILYYEDGLWKFVSDRSTNTEPKDMHRMLANIGLIVEGYKLKDASRFVSGMRATLQQRMQ